jgi:hypothetical protein
VPLLMLTNQITSGMGGCKTAILRRNAQFDAICSAAAAHVQVSGVPTPMGASEVLDVLCCLSDGSSVKSGNTLSRFYMECVHAKGGSRALDSTSTCCTAQACAA